MADATWITTKEAAELTGFHQEYIRELVRTKKIRGRKFGIVWQVHQKSLLDYIETGRESTDGRRGPKE